MRPDLSQINQNTLPTIFPPAGNFTSIAKILNIVLPLVVFGSSLVFLAMFIISGFMYLMSEGNAEAIKKAQKTMTYSIIGIIIVSISFFIVKLMGVALNVSLPF